MKHLFVVSIFIIVCIVAGCSGIADGDDVQIATAVYNSENGYSLDIPDQWLQENVSEETVRFTDADNQISLTITTELGGVAYYSLPELMAEFQEETAEEIFTEYKILDEDSSTEHISLLMTGADQEDAAVTARLYIEQPFVGMHHYITVLAASSVYEDQEAVVDEILDSFTITFDQDKYLGLMKARREELTQ